MKNLYPKKTIGSQNIWYYWLTIISLLALGFIPPLAIAANTVIGSVFYVEGSVTAQESITMGGGEVFGGQRELKPGDKISVHDMIKSHEPSKLKIKFIDGAIIVLRPNTDLFVEKYSESEAELEIIRGGIRTVTGDIAKQNPDLYKIKTPDGFVTAKSEGSDFSVRYCYQDCDQENRSMTGPKMKTKLPVIAKVVAIQGDVTAGKKYKRKLDLGYPVYSTEHLASTKDSYAQLQFVDGSSVIIQADSSFDISDYQYNQKGKENRSDFNLLKGGLRFVTGLMGKEDPETFRLKTYAVSMGIHGTDFGVNIVGADDSADGGVVTHVFSGSVGQTNNSGSTVLNAGSYSVISNLQSAPVVSTTPPATFGNNIAPPPSESAVNTKTLFASSTGPVAPGTHVNVNKGRVEVAGTSGGAVAVDANLAVAVSASGRVSSPGAVNSFQSMDPVSITLPPIASAMLPPNTIRIGPAEASGNISANTAVGSMPVTTNVVQEQTITSPYNR